MLLCLQKEMKIRGSCCPPPTHSFTSGCPASGYPYPPTPLTHPHTHPLKSSEELTTRPLPSPTNPPTSHSTSQHTHPFNLASKPIVSDLSLSPSVFRLDCSSAALPARESLISNRVSAWRWRSRKHQAALQLKCMRSSRM